MQIPRSVFALLICALFALSAYSVLPRNSASSPLFCTSDYSYLIGTISATPQEYYSKDCSGTCVFGYCSSTNQNAGGATGTSFSSVTQKVINLAPISITAGPGPYILDSAIKINQSNLLIDFSKAGTISYSGSSAAFLIGSSNFLSYLTLSLPKLNGGGANGVEFSGSAGGGHILLNGIDFDGFTNAAIYATGSGGFGDVTANIVNMLGNKYGILANISSVSANSWESQTWNLGVIQTSTSVPSIGIVLGTQIFGWRIQADLDATYHDASYQAQIFGHDNTLFLTDSATKVDQVGGQPVDRNGINLEPSSYNNDVTYNDQSNAVYMNIIDNGKTNQIKFSDPYTAKNYLSNGNMENSSSWSAFGGASYSRETNFVKDGAYSMLINASNSYNDGLVSTPLSSSLQGQNLTMACWINVPASDTSKNFERFGLSWNGAGGFVSNIPLSDGQWHFMSIEGIIPSNAMNIVARIYADQQGTGTNSNNTVYYDDCTVTLGTAPLLSSS